MTRLHPRTWILVADGTKARAYAWVDADMPLVPLDGYIFHHPHQSARDLGTDRPGRVFESMGTARSAHQPHTDPVRHAQHQFATAVADALDTALSNDAFDRLIMLAGPTMLGDLRAACSGPLRAAVLAERTKDLTHFTLPELQQYVLAEELLHTAVVRD